MLPTFVSNVDAPAGKWQCPWCHVKLSTAKEWTSANHVRQKHKAMLQEYRELNGLKKCQVNFLFSKRRKREAVKATSELEEAAKGWTCAVCGDALPKTISRVTREFSVQEHYKEKHPGQDALRAQRKLTRGIKKTEDASRKMRQTMENKSEAKYGKALKRLGHTVKAVRVSWGGWRKEKLAQGTFWSCTRCRYEAKDLLQKKITCEPYAWDGSQNNTWRPSNRTWMRMSQAGNEKELSSLWKMSEDEVRGRKPEVGAAAMADLRGGDASDPNRS